MTKIEWTEKTWNPIAGCSVTSPGCKRCYAMKMAARLEAMGVKHYRGLTQPSKEGSVWTGKLAFAPEKTLLEPLRRKKPTMWFVNSMSDLFHEGVPDKWIDQVFAAMALCPQHTFQVLTKRAERMRKYMASLFDRSVVFKGRHMVLAHFRTIGSDGAQVGPMPLPNIWLGVSCEDQKRADERIPHLLETQAAVRFISAEPLLGPINLLDVAKDGRGGNAIYSRSRPRLDWVIVGGESGPGARPMHPDWARSLRGQCQAAGVPYFFKQHGTWLPLGPEDDWGREWMLMDQYGKLDLPDHRAPDFGIGELPVVRVGKKSAGRLLDGLEWNEMPLRAA